MGLLKEDWLPLAEKLAVGMSARYRHGREGRPNLVVKNLSDRYVAYCQSCKEGGVHMKEHVRIGVPVPTGPEPMTTPEDCVLIHKDSLAPATIEGIGAFLAIKGMDFKYLPRDLYYSRSRKRLVICSDGHILGRDLTGRSPHKWMHYCASAYLGKPQVGDTAFVVEDPFSYYKLRWAIADQRAVHVYCSLGTGLTDQLAVALLGHDRVVFFYDGDEAGEKHGYLNAKRMRGMGVTSVWYCAPSGMDPKDMSVLALQLHVEKHK